MSPSLLPEIVLPTGNTYTPRWVDCFEPTRIVLARGWNRTSFGQSLTEKILSLYPKIVPEDCSDMAHPNVSIEGSTPGEQHFIGKQTLVIGEHRSAVRLSSEEGNTCPNYWHFAPDSPDDILESLLTADAEETK